ncbi:MAG: hypothetical protein OXM03_07705 [Chloroflexota bacterium]|nr:hypothetical protein [Chloroflexota bacterium]MDE2840500.1 hypothetical protein [Chloroflexota bacterium]MDE2932194.1 hypothetical protein [Chloroflexota bacterium]
MSLADTMQSVRPGVWRWTAPHPDWSPWDPMKKTGFGWSQEVASVCYETPDGLVLIDPLAPPCGTPAHRQLWQTLDAAVQAKRQPVTILLSTDWHDRSAQAVFERYSQQYGAGIWVHEAMPQDLLNCQPTHTFREGDLLAGSVQVFFIESPHPEVAFYLTSARTLVVADALWGTPDGRLWIGSHEFCSILPRLLSNLTVETLLLSHAEPIVLDAHSVLARVARERPEWTE